MSKKTISIEEDIHKKAKLLSVETGLTVGKIVELLILRTSEKDIMKLAEKAN